MTSARASASLSYLKHLPADYLKIDIEFVRELTTNEADARVVRGIVGLAREFNQITIAEGVEDEATLLMLKELGVDQAQGYLFARPGPLAGALAPTGRRTARAAERRGPIPWRSSGGVRRLRRPRRDGNAQPLPARTSCCGTFATSRLAERTEPYRGHDGSPRLPRRCGQGLGRADLHPDGAAPDAGVGDRLRTHRARRGAETDHRQRAVGGARAGGQIASIEVFQAVQRTAGGLSEPRRPPAERISPQRWRCPSAATVRRGRAGSLTGAACIARRRTSRQDMPSLRSAGAPIRIAVATSTACRITP